MLAGRSEPRHVGAILRQAPQEKQAKCTKGNGLKGPKFITRGDQGPADARFHGRMTGLVDNGIGQGYAWNAGIDVLQGARQPISGDNRADNVIPSLNNRHGQSLQLCDIAQNVVFFEEHGVDEIMRLDTGDSQQRLPAGAAAPRWG